MQPTTAPMARPRSSGRCLCPQRGSQGRASGLSSERLPRPAPGGRLCRVWPPGHRSRKRGAATGILLAACRRKFYDIHAGDLVVAARPERRAHAGIDPRSGASATFRILRCRKRYLAISAMLIRPPLQLSRRGLRAPAASAAGVGHVFGGRNLLYAGRLISGDQRCCGWASVLRCAASN
jgi:hypothetical protein